MENQILLRKVARLWHKDIWNTPQGITTSMSNFPEIETASTTESSSSVVSQQTPEDIVGNDK